MHFGENLDAEGVLDPELKQLGDFFGRLVSETHDRAEVRTESLE